MDEKRPRYIASCSFGKDSIATILLALIHGEPLDEVVSVEVMFDKERGISGEIPEHIEWIYNVAKPKLEEMGLKVTILQTSTDLVYWFHRRIQKPGERYMKKYGFPIAGKCIINNRCKIKAIKDYEKKLDESGKFFQYIGIAYDEPRRLERLKKNQISLLAKYHYTEKMALELCKEYGLLSPMYEISLRGGVLVLPESKIPDAPAF